MTSTRSALWLATCTTERTISSAIVVGIQCRCYDKDRWRILLGSGLQKKAMADEG
jgi:hypothetical protein